MKTKQISLVLVAVLLILLGVNGCSTYNSFVAMSENVDGSWAKVENQYQRRFDLIPNLVATVKGYAKHESETLMAVTNARTGLTQAYDAAKGLQGSDLSAEKSFEQYTRAQAELNKAFNVYVNAVKEAYPDLKADKNFLDLQTQLEGTENRIATERTYYTNAVKEYNVKVRTFPNKLWASLFGFTTKPQFAADEAATVAPKVEF